jgi:meckelin
MLQALKDVDYVVSEKNFFEKVFDCEMYSNISDSKGVFYFDNGHSFDKVLFYGNENSIFGFEYLLFIFLLFATGNFLIAILSIGIVFKVII